MTGGIQLGRILAGESHASVVYFLAMTYGGRPAVKIGTSARLKTRIRTVSYAAELTDVLLLVPGAGDVEAALHDKFREYQIPPFAELFWLEGRLRDFVAPAPPHLPLTVRLRRRWWSRSVEPAPEPEPAVAPEPALGPAQAPPPGITVDEAVAAGIFGARKAAAVKKQFQRNRNAPSPVLAGFRGGATHRYDEDALRAYAAKEMGVALRD